MEEATRDGLAQDQEIQQWIEDGLLKLQEAATAFRGWAETQDRVPAPLATIDLDAVLAAYETYSIRTSKARDPERKTHQVHMSTARQVLLWMADKIPPTLEDCEKYRDKLAQTLAPWTVHRRITTVRLLLDRAVELGMLTENVARGVRLDPPKRETARRILTHDEIRQLLDGCGQWPNLMTGAMPVVVGFGLYAGLRDEEMCWAKPSWLQGRILTVQRSRDGVGRVWTPKDHEARRIDVKPALVDTLESHKHDWDFILRGKWKEKPVLPNSVSRAFRRMVARLEMDPAITLYSLRHTYATELLRVADLRTVQLGVVA